LARTEETGSGWIAHPMKKLPTATDQVMGLSRSTRAARAGSPRSTSGSAIRRRFPILAGLSKASLVLAEPAGRSPRAGVKVTTVLGDPLAPKAFSLIAIHKHGIPFAFMSETLDEGSLAAKVAIERGQARRPAPLTDCRDRPQ
jgi:ribonuclease R